MLQTWLARPAKGRGKCGRQARTGCIRLTGTTLRDDGWVDTCENRSVPLHGMPWDGWPSRCRRENQAASGHHWRRCLEPAATLVHVSLDLDDSKPGKSSDLAVLDPGQSHVAEDATLLARLHMHDAKGADSRI